MTPTARPRFRTDLVAEPIEDGGHRYIDVVDPDTGNGFRFYDVEYSLACAMDGERDVEGLVVWAKEELGIEPSSNELATVISTLGDLGYLADGAAAPLEADTELAPGVYAAPRGADAPPVEDVELGQGGAAAYAPEDVALPRGDFELGMSGGGAPTLRTPSEAVSGPELGAAGGPREMVMEFEAPTPPPAEAPYASMRPTTRPDAEDDGPTNLPNPATSDFDDDEVSVDLSDHLAISASDVKEAVRASKVMKAVDLPADLQAQLDSSERELAAAKEAAERVAAERAEAQRAAEAQRLAEERAAEERAAAERLAAEAAARPPVELPRPPVGVSRPKSTTAERPNERPVEKTPAVSVAKEPVKTPAPSGGGAMRTVLLLLLLLAVGAAAYWFGVLKKPLPWKKASDTPAETAGPGPGPATGAGPSTGAVQPTPPPTPPPPPPPPSATLAESAGAPTDVTAGQVGVVEFIAAEGSTVAAGDPLVRFKGNPAWASKLVGLDYDIDNRVPKQIADATKARDAAQASGNAAQVKRHQATIDERTKRLADKVNERQAIRDSQDALTVKSPAGGVVAMKIAKGARSKADQVVATVTPAPVLSASFTIPAGAKAPAVDASVRVAVKASPETKANCTVTAAEGVQVTVVCPADAGIAAGTEIILE